MAGVEAHHILLCVHRHAFRPIEIDVYGRTLEEPIIDVAASGHGKDEAVGDYEPYPVAAPPGRLNVAYSIWPARIDRWVVVVTVIRPAVTVSVVVEALLAFVDAEEDEEYQSSESRSKVLHAASFWSGAGPGVIAYLPCRSVLRSEDPLCPRE